MCKYLQYNISISIGYSRVISRYGIALGDMIAETDEMLYWVKKAAIMK